MTRQSKILLLLILCSCVVFLQTPAAQKNHHAKSAKPARAIDDAALRNADTRTGKWITQGRNYTETRISPLKTIDASKGNDLHLDRSFNTNTTRGFEATPLKI